MEPRGLPGKAIEPLVALLKDDPRFLETYNKIGAEKGGEWNVFNMLRDPSWKKSDQEKIEGAEWAGVQALEFHKIPENEMTIQDVRDAITIALNT